jgi:hypothetical protein
MSQHEDTKNNYGNFIENYSGRRRQGCIFRRAVSAGLAFVIGVVVGGAGAVLSRPPLCVSDYALERFGNVSVRATTGLVGLRIGEWNSSVTDYIRRSANFNSDSPFSTLEFIEVSCVHRQHVDLSFLSETHSLKDVTIINASLDDSQLPMLLQSVALREVRIIGCNVSHEAMAILSERHMLRVLDVSDSKVPASGIKIFLSNCKGPLNYIGLSGTKTEDEIVEACKKRMPHTRIVQHESDEY